MRDAVFIYEKDSIFKVLDIEKAKNIGESLIKDGWKHIVTLSASVWLEILFNAPPGRSDDVIEELLYRD